MEKGTPGHKTTSTEELKFTSDIKRLVCSLRRMEGLFLLTDDGEGGKP